MKVDIEKRREKILRIVINNYISTGNPVSSRTICNKYKVDLCPASVRNVLADLEEQGLITHMHTSAGRIPTDKGYRYYVDHLLKYSGLTPAEQALISKEYLSKYIAQEDVMRNTSKLLSNLTSYAAVVSQPEIKRTTFKHIQFTLLDPKKVCVTLIANTGMVKSSVVRFEVKVDKDKLQRIQNLMNSQLEDIPLAHIKMKLRKMMIQERNAFFQILQQAINIVDLSSIIDDDMRFYLEGISKVLDFPEFRNSESARFLIKALDEKITLSDMVRDLILQAPIPVKPCVFIGQENPGALGNNCSVVMSSYKVGSETVGGLGIIGPKRMDYGKAIAIVQYVSDMLSEELNRFSI
jgi:heat-inducible transcriptional repressor